ncbi:MAG: hypothetical protein KDD67_12290 [Ignavibacteriae bacterium]|nr:hypothetical protein [Ignavibacteriota bacterium]MCB9217207.1 hypothetical protein [Ignavibacteria bacterium]
MHCLTFFPLGNADCCRIDLGNGKKILFDYANMRCSDDENDKRIDLPSELRRDLEETGKKSFDVVAITHLDKDHICGLSEFFQLDHDKSFQDDDRPQIDELWVPAAIITEDGCENEAAIVQAEARFRLKQGTGIRVFSRPNRLKDWLEAEGLKLEDRLDLITDAGQTIPGLELETDGLEFFVHSPFAIRQNDCDLEDRNIDSLIVQATFTVEGVNTKVLLGADAGYEVIADMVKVTRDHAREERLEWDIFKLCHHCSYTALGPDKGEEETEPIDEVKWLFETQSQSRALIVSTSWPIENKDSLQPPHYQAAAYYRRSVNKKNGEFRVTMEHPKPTAPEPLVIKIDASGATVKKEIPLGISIITETSAPRAGLQ